MRLICWIPGWVAVALAGAVEVPFFDPTMPVHASPVDAGEGGVVSRGLLVRAGEGQWVVFDQELLRPAQWLPGERGKDPLSLETMAQVSWHEPTRKAGVKVPRPLAEGRLLVPALPGAGVAVEDVTIDPRPGYGGSVGRGGLEATGRKFLGYEVSAAGAVLRYRIGGTEVREWYEAEREALRRHFAVEAGGELVFVAGPGGNTAGAGGVMQITSNHPGLKLEAAGGLLVGRLAASANERRVSLVYSAGAVAGVSATPKVPAGKVARWPETLRTAVREGDRSGPGWQLDQIELPEGNPWKRRIRAADVAFLENGQAAVVTFDGDVWQVELVGGRASWRRVAAGLCEPLAIGRAGGLIQVFTRNGLVRLHDTNGDGEADFYENHSSLMVQTTSTRGYPLDMEVDADGATWCSIGGIATGDKSITNRPPADPHSGGILYISPDGESLEVVASRAREPFFARDPQTGALAMSDQQGHYVPSSGIFPVSDGAHFGYGGGDAVAAAVWIPHEQEPSSASPLWMRGTAFQQWEGGLLNLSYGSGRLFLVRAGGGWPATRGAVIPLEIETGLPLLHGRVDPADGSLWLAGFRIYDSRVSALEGLARLRPAKDAPLAPVDAAIYEQGVVISFGSAVDPASVDAGKVTAREWQYERTSGYGSPRFKRDGTQGVDALATGAVWLSKDGKSVFVHIPDLRPTMQLEVAHPFHGEGAGPRSSVVYFSAAELPPAPWIELGFDLPDLDGSVARVRGGVEGMEPTVEVGKATAHRYGCTACHSVDGATDGHSGPTWSGLFGTERKFKDGSSVLADKAYLRRAIVDPQSSVVEGYELGMASYEGVLSEAEIQSVILYIESLK
jgi:cytochrome c2